MRLMVQGFIGPIGLMADAPGSAQESGKGGEQEQQGEKCWGGGGLRS